MVPVITPRRARLTKDLGIDERSGEELTAGSACEIVGIDIATKNVIVHFNRIGHREGEERLVPPDALAPLQNSMMEARFHQKARARIRVYDAPGKNYGPGATAIVRAEPGEIGEVVHVDDGIWPTVMFERGATMVNDDECELVLDEAASSADDLPPGPARMHERQQKVQQHHDEALRAHFKGRAP